MILMILSLEKRNFHSILEEFPIGISCKSNIFEVDDQLVLSA